MKKGLFIVLLVLLTLSVFVGCCPNPKEKEVINVKLYYSPKDGEFSPIMDGGSNKTIEVDVSGKTTFEELTLNIECDDVFGSGSGSGTITMDQYMELEFTICYFKGVGNTTYGCQLFKTDDDLVFDNFSSLGISKNDEIEFGETFYGLIFKETN